VSGIALISTTSRLEERVREAFGGELNGQVGTWTDVLTADDPAERVNQLAATAPGVVAIDADIPVEWAIHITSLLDALRPDTSVVLLARPTTELWEQAARAGARDLLAPDIDGPGLREALERARQTAERRRQAMGATATVETPRGRIIVVISPKGGSGKTTMSTNLAVGLAQNAPGQVVLVDLDLQFGDVANCLHLLPEVTIADLFRSHGPVDATSLKTFLTTHPTGVHTLCAPRDLAEADDIPADGLAVVFDLLSAEFPYIVVDTAAGVDEYSLVAVEKATDLLLLSSTDVPSVRALRRQIEAMDRLGITRPRRHFVLNRANAKVGLDIADIEATVGLPIEAQIPSNKIVPVSTNMGQPLLQEDGRSPVAKAMLGLAATFAGESADEGSGRGGFLRRGGGS
jgi:pilus assembly protein CpaE